MKALIENKTTFLKQKITGFGDEILMVNGEDQEYVNRQLNDKGISAQVNVVEEVLYYQIKFPIHLVEANSKSLPSMGIAIKGIKSARATQPDRIKSSAGGIGSGGRGSGGRGGGRKGGGSKGSTSSQSQPRTQMSGLSKDMKIWFKLDLQQ